MRKHQSIPYQEEPGGSFTHNGIEYDLNGVLSKTASQPTKRIFVWRIRWVLAFDQTDPARVEKADITCPLIVTFSDKRFVVLDGLHRLAKAVEVGLKTLPCHFIDEERLSEFRLSNRQLVHEEGRIVQGVNTTVDVKVGETKRQAKKMGFETTPEGVPVKIYTQVHAKDLIKKPGKR